LLQNYRYFIGIYIIHPGNPITCIHLNKATLSTTIRNMAGIRRKAAKSTPAPSTSKRLKSIDLAKDDESVESEEDDYQKEDLSDDDDDEEEETVDAKRVRLARDYLQRLEAAPGESSSEEEDEEEEPMNMRDRVSMRLQRERLKREGLLERNVAHYVERDVAWMHREIGEKAPAATKPDQDAKNWIDSGRIQLFRGHELTPTSVALQTTGERAISGAKDNSVILWDVEHQTKIDYIVRPWKKGEQRGDGEALCVATSDDGRYAAVGRRDATVNIFDIRVSSTTGSSKNSLITSFKGHKGPVTCLAFRTQSNQLFSGSEDRCIRYVWQITV
jgi:ribosomal RNA-processing protein 9